MTDAIAPSDTRRAFALPDADKWLDALPVAILGVDAGERIRMVNAAGADFLAPAGRGLVGRRIADVFGPDSPIVDLARRALTHEHRLSEADVRYVAAAANHDLLELALAGATPELAERVLRALAPDQSRSLRNRLDRLAPTRMSDITQAQRELARLAFELLAATRDSATTGTRLVA